MGVSVVKKRVTFNFVRKFDIRSFRIEDRVMLFKAALMMAEIAGLTCEVAITPQRNSFRRRLERALLRVVRDRSNGMLSPIFDVPEENHLEELSHGDVEDMYNWVFARVDQGFRAWTGSEVIDAWDLRRDMLNSIAEIRDSAAAIADVSMESNKSLGQDTTGKE